MDIFYTRGKRELKITAEQLSQLLHGSCIAGLYLTTLKRPNNIHQGVALKTSDNFTIEIGFSAASVIVVADFGDSDILPIDLLKGYEGSAFNIENKIRALRQLYATLFLVETDQAKNIPPEAELDPAFDIEQKLLSDKDRLQFRSVGFGSLSVLLNSLTEGGRKAIVTVVALFLPETRQELIRQLRAESDKAETSAERERFDLNVHKANALINLEKKIDKLDTGTRERVERLLTRHLDDIGISPPNKRITKKE
jgi:hypothetical protein